MGNWQRKVEAGVELTHRIALAIVDGAGNDKPIPPESTRKERQTAMERYIEPHLKLVGEAQDVILGSLGVGNDINGEVLSLDTEFAADPTGSAE